jgi:hypothetical protein
MENVDAHKSETNECEEEHTHDDEKSMKQNVLALATKLKIGMVCIQMTIFL